MDPLVDTHWSLVRGGPATTLQEIRWGPPRGALRILTLHDGAEVPPAAEAFAAGLAPEGLRAELEGQRDWGADAVACTLAQELGLGAVLRVRRARPFLDCGRRPGVSPGGCTGLETSAVPSRIAGVPVPPALRLALLEEHAQFLEDLGRALEGARLLLTVHTWDPVGAQGRRRPALGLVDRFLDGSEPTCPQSWVRALSEALSLEAAPPSHNHPYRLPPGGLEARLAAQCPRLSTLVLEVRKDLLLDGECLPGGGFRPVPDSWNLDFLGRLGRGVARGLQGFRSRVPR